MKTYITHAENFHADDVFSYVVLKLAFPGIEHTLIRTRDPEIINTGDVVFDVGGIHDPSLMRFDHHQTGGAGTRDNGLPYAAFGLVWKQFGAQIMGSAEAAAVVDEKFVQSIDAMDNGVSLYSLNEYEVNPVTLSEVIEKFFNPTWSEVDFDYDGAFMDAVPMAEAILSRVMLQSKDYLLAHEYVTRAYEEAEDKRIILLDAAYPSNHTLLAYPEPIYVIRPRRNGTWGIGCVEDKVSFTKRKALPLAWAGKMNEELAAITGIPEAIFCHKGLFLAVTKTKESAIELAKLALRE